MKQEKRENRTRGEDTIRDDGDLKKYRTETPNLMHHLRLTPFEFTLYSHLKRTAGAGENGRCFKSTETLAEETEMSPGMISKAKKGLLRTDRPGLNGKALIRIEKDESRPGRPRDIVTIEDIWPENFLFFGRQSSPQSSHSELQSSPQSSLCEPKNKTESSKKELLEERTEETLNVADGPREKTDATPTQADATPTQADATPTQADATPTQADATPDPQPTSETKPSLTEQTLNASQSDFEDLLPESLLPESLLEEPEPKAGPPRSSGLKAAEIDRVVQLTGDEGSRRRFEQLYDLAEGAGMLLCWDHARKATHKALQSNAILGAPGAYFNGLVAKLLNEQSPALVPVGTPQERKEVRGLARSSLAAAEPLAGESQAGPERARLDQREPCKTGESHARGHLKREDI